MSDEVGEKICTCCKNSLTINLFAKDKRNKDGLNTQCRKCVHEKRVRYREKFIERDKQKMKEYYSRNKESQLKKGKERYKLKKEEITKKNIEYVLKNKEKVAERKKNHYLKNKEKYIRRTTLYCKNRRKTDQFYLFACRIRRLIRQSLLNKKYSKKSKTHQILGESYDVVYNHLVKTAYNNYGDYTGSIKDYHIDHIMPCSFAKTENELLELQNYKNLQLLKPEDNLKKSDKLDFKL